MHLLFCGTLVSSALWLQEYGCIWLCGQVQGGGIYLMGYSGVETETVTTETVTLTSCLFSGNRAIKVCV